jgi:murein DD-endopeptidase MepM/ murein hydrolase activator NlpD
MPGDAFSHNLWERLTRLGLAGAVIRLGTHAALIALILLVALGMRSLYPLRVLSDVPAENPPVAQATQAATSPAPTLSPQPLRLPGYTSFSQPAVQGIPRQSDAHTDIPSRPRDEVSLYTVQPGDTLFGIAQKFGLRPETLLWSNQLILGDNPHQLLIGQTLNILPVDGAYYRWSAGDSLTGVARFFNVQPEAIIRLPANHLDEATLGDWAAPDIEPGAWLVIPGGQRAFINWSMPPQGVPRQDPSVARGLGDGVCGQKVDGALGSGLFIWPADHHYLSGFGWLPETNHPAIDIDGDEGSPVYAADSGVVVYAGWNNWGYGNVIILDHGNGWQTLYAHLSAYLVSCGQSVTQGSVMGAFGSTGNSTGAHLHFEIAYQGSRVNPLDYLP